MGNVAGKVMDASTPEEAGADTSTRRPDDQGRSPGRDGETEGAERSPKDQAKVDREAGDVADDLADFA